MGLVFICFLWLRFFICKRIVYLEKNYFLLENQILCLLSLYLDYHKWYRNNLPLSSKCFYVRFQTELKIRYFKCLMTLACLENSPISVGSMVIRGIFLLKIYLWLWMLQKHNNCNISKKYLESSADCMKTLLGRIDFSVFNYGPSF